MGQALNKLIYTYFRVGKCSGRLRCCKAHSLEELQEWSLRYQHRRQGAKPESPAELVSMATMGVALSSYNAIKVGVNPSLNEVITIGKSITWTLTIKGQVYIHFKIYSSIMC